MFTKEYHTILKQSDSTQLKAEINEFEKNILKAEEAIKNLRENKKSYLTKVTLIQFNADLQLYLDAVVYYKKIIDFAVLSKGENFDHQFPSISKECIGSLH